MPLDHRRDTKHATSTATSLVQNPHAIVTGVLLRSDVVSGWPGLLVDGYSGQRHETQLPLLPVERLSKNVLLCLFVGKVTAVDIHQKPETLHFGFNRPDASAPGSDYSKDKIGPIAWKEKDKRVVDICKLTQGSHHSAQFALDMIAGVERVRFQLA